MVSIPSYASETYGLKGSYEVEINILGSDQASINKGMLEGLKYLVLNISGSSDDLDKGKLKKLLKDPQQFVTEYRLELDKNKNLKAYYSFEGDSIRQLLMANGLPLWVGKKPKILVFFPCLLQDNPALSLEEKLQNICNDVVSSLKVKAFQRMAAIGFPSLDFIDLNLFDLFLPLSPEQFMNKISKRYNYDNWIYCSNKDEFGMEKVTFNCFSSITPKNLEGLDLSFNNLIDSIKQRSQLLIDDQIRSNIFINLEGINSHKILQQALLELEQQIIVKKVSLTGIKDNKVKILLNISGTKSDFIKMVAASSNFSKIPSYKITDSLNFIYKVSL